ncbi:hypothetical protein BX600DRAFT_443425 [Xylariales sp. PMI_506]|nr:hypothetical protein BX600DRAFT_443425 [Xylariales sp. PMI_506]
MATPQAIGSVVGGDTLLQTFEDLRQFTTMLNGANVDSLQLQGAEFQQQVFSIQYRLLQLQEALGDIPSECLRLGMLAFFTTAFHLPESQVRYPHISKHFRISCRALGDSTLVSQDLVLWLLVVGAISLFGVSESWLCDL